MRAQAEQLLPVLARMQVCKKGSVLDPNQVAILRVFDIKMAKFKLKLLAVWEGKLGCDQRLMPQAA